MILHTERCLKVIHKNSTCMKCQTICPTHALDFSMNMPHIDALKCSNCGACTHVCPMDVFESQTPSDETLMASIESKNAKNEEIVFTCKQIHIFDNTSIGVLCLARLDRSTLLYTAMTATQDVHILHGECAKCPFACTKSLIEVTLNDVSALVSLANLPIQLHVAQQKESINHHEERQNEQIRQGKIRRRFLLKLLGKHTDAEDTSILKSEKTAQILTHRIEKYGIYTKQQRYISILKRLFSKKENLLSTIIGTKPIINAQDCQQCSVCTHVCPSGALSLAEGTSFGILFYPSLCIECHLCADICFTHAISQENKILYDIIENNVEILFQNDFRVNPEQAQTKVAVYRT